METILRLDLEEAYRNERERLLGYARARVGSIEAAEDIVQEVFLRAVVNANSLAVVDNAIGWLYAHTLGARFGAAACH